MGKADLHIHTTVSDGMATVAAVLDHVEVRTDLDVIAITDHEDTAGGQRARELAAKRGLRVEVIVGAEITTRHGHLLALFIEETPPSFRSAEATIEAIHAQGGLAIVPHPMSWLTRSLSERTIDRIVSRREAGVTFDGIETANPSLAGKLTAAKTRARNRAWALPGIGGSDAHHLPHVATGWTEFDGHDAAELRRAIIAGTTTARIGSYPGIREVGVGQVALGLAWGYAATPRKVIAKSRQRAGAVRK
ncbi:MAG TPA: PHP-associated domain-containing protein [Tepidiformaceae bacterium]|nr:PHP-associated domain-containing protein [Tepidiformaceae bacterium]